jgi:hypothetical protein
MIFINKLNPVAAYRALLSASPAVLLPSAVFFGALIGGGGWYAAHGFSRPVAPPPAAASQPAGELTPESIVSSGSSQGPSKPGSPAAAPKASAGTSAQKSTPQNNPPAASAGGSSGNTGGASGGTAKTYASETNFAAAAFTAVRTINVTTQSAFMTAWNAIQPGDLINVSGVTFTGEITLANKNLTNWAEIHFDASTKFVGVSSVQNLPAVWINNDSYIRFYGGDISDSASGGQAGPGILVYDSSYITWWGFVSHDVGRDGLDIFSVNKPNSSLDFKGEVYHWGLNLAWDPHAEKGTGLHGANLGDSNYGMQDSRVALYAHDGAAGAGIEAGGSKSTDFFKNNTIYVWCQNLTMVALSQTGGNCVQYWGENVTGNVIKYLEAENLQGRPYETGGMYSGQSLSSDTIEYGRASNTNLNKNINDSIPQSVLWDYQFGTVFIDVSPIP